MSLLILLTKLVLNLILLDKKEVLLLNMFLFFLKKGVCLLIICKRTITCLQKNKPFCFKIPFCL